MPRPDRQNRKGLKCPLIHSLSLWIEDPTANANHNPQTNPKVTPQIEDVRRKNHTTTATARKTGNVRKIRRNTASTPEQPKSNTFQ
jgi:hypothetical protein